MKRIAVVALIVLFAAGMAFAKEYTADKTVGPYHVSISIDRNPPVVGDNNMAITVKDGSGKYVTDAKVTVEYSMPAMQGMPAMNYKTAATLKGNEYQGKINLSMSGAWNLAVKVSKGGKTSTAKFNVEAH
jgi:predicted S18 family serine protease